MRILFIGDVFGRSGREAVHEYLPKIKKEVNADLAIVNGENAAHGRGITPKFADSFFADGADCITTGNHIWDQREIIPYINKNQALLRPANLPDGTPGKGVWEHSLPDGRKAVVINIMTRLFMELSDDPFRCMDDLLKMYKLGQNCHMIFVDCHGEATSEKIALAHYLDGRITALVGTHTHIPTSDHHILKGGTAYQTDAGMTGCYDSVIGIRKEAAIGRFLKKIPYESFNPADGEATICGTFIETADKTGLSSRISTFRYGGILSEQPLDV